MGQTQAKLTPGRPWADQPFKLIESPAHRTGKPFPKYSALAMANEMTIVHNHLIRILNCIYLQAPFVSEPKDVSDFAVFMHAWLMLIHEHHGNEEELFFPWIEEYIGVKGYMDVNVEQHHAFGPGMRTFEAYVDALRKPEGEAGKEVYDGQKVRSIIDSFGEVLTVHLKDEIAFLEGLEKFNDKIDFEALNKRIQKHAVATAETEFVIPCMLTNGDNTWEAGVHDAYWPPFPFYVGWMFRLLYMPKQAGAWRFSCSDGTNNPRDLRFLGDQAGKTDGILDSLRVQ